LNFFKNYFVTGDYAVASIGMRAIDGTSLDLDNDPGFGTRMLSMSLPDDGDDKVILTAFLYWQTIVSANQGSGTDGVLFRGHDLVELVDTVPQTTAELLNPTGTTPCWSNGGAAGPADGTKKLLSYRTDVLRFLPRALIDHDKNPATPPLPIGERVVDDQALAANLAIAEASTDPATQALAADYEPTTVRVPSSGSGNQVPLTNGVSLVVIYRDEKPGAKFRGISIYDGGYSLDQQHDAMTQTIRGFYQASSVAPEAKVTQIVGDGQTFPERVAFNGGLGDQVIGGPGGGPLTGADGERWDAYTISNLPVAGDAPSVTLTVDHGSPQKFTPYDCLSWSAILFSTAVQDTDGDGLLDVWEENSSNNPITDPNGVPLPPLADMGANKNVKDMFFQMDFMTAATGYSTPTESNVLAHSHAPDYASLNMVGVAFQNKNINVHFDAGGLYPGQPYIIPTQYANGGQAIPETQECPVPAQGQQPACAFPGFYGVVGWKSAFMRYRDEVINAPQPLPQTYVNSEQWCVAHEPGGAAFNPDDQSTWCQRRFDRIRLPMFRYALWVHFLGRAQKDDPTTTTIDESLFPRKNSGIADLPGGDLMMALGGFVDVRLINNVPTPTYNASVVTQASTFMHEVGHTLYRMHGGDPGLPNCRPNYISVMNYLFQLAGLVKANNSSAIDYAGVGFGALDETNLKEGVGLGGAMPYRTRWNAYRYNTVGTNLPSIHNGSVLDAQLGTTPLRRHCSGTPITADAERDPGPLGPTSTVGYDAMVRVDGTTTAAPIDWDADQQNDGNTAIAPQDISFNGTKSTLEASTSDWGKLQFQQLASRRNAANGSIGAMSVGFNLADLGPAGDEGVGDEGVGDEGVGDEGVGDEGVGDEGVGDEGVGDEGVGDEGVGDEGVGDEPSVDDGLHSPPSFATAQSSRTGIRVTWGKPPVGVVDQYAIFRGDADRNGVLTSSTLTFIGLTIPSGPSPAEPPTFIDDSTAAQSKYYIYFVNAEVRPSVAAPDSTTVVTSYRQSNLVRR
jgi:hypothetical protein